MNKNTLVSSGLLMVAVIIIGFFLWHKLQQIKNASVVSSMSVITIPTVTPNPTQPVAATLPLAINQMRQKKYPGSAITVEQTISTNSLYTQYLTSYLSEGLKIYALLTVPTGTSPTGGWPVILLNHGYIPPSEYVTTQSYQVAVVPLASHGYVTFMPDYRGNGNSQGTPQQIYISAGYVTDSLNALASIKKYPGVNPNKIGVWGHSMGGNITLHELVITHDLKAAEIWSGVVGSYQDIYDWFQNRMASGVLTTQNDQDTAQLIDSLVTQYQTPEKNPAFWNQLDPVAFLTDVTTPIDLQIGTADTVVPPSFSQNLANKLKSTGKTVTLTTYPKADHNLSPDQNQAIAQTLQFFDKYLK